MHLVIFARTPAAGTAKTRLIPLLGAAGAAAAAERLLREQVSRAAGVAGETTLCVTSATPAMHAVAAASGFKVCEQRGADLGERMADALASGAPAPRVLIGTDCPSLDAAYLQAAFAALHDNDVVFGPEEDGGYGLVGCRGAVPRAIFEDIAWSTPQVLDQSLAKARLLKLRAHCLSALWDVDTPEDWHRYVAWCVGRTAPQAAGVLRDSD